MLLIGEVEEERKVHLFRKYEENFQTRNDECHVVDEAGARCRMMVRQASGCCCYDAQRVQL
jgi:hypothetical protein